ncbi:MAG: leucine-rich repeat domain-containing protein, partial [Cyanobacteria bacterium CAN_BIN43]|nr:leucine-rich repeat domain-containing protein [Cyanobacteria bacterium CAN_BIN43]
MTNDELLKVIQQALSDGATKLDLSYRRFTSLVPKIDQLVNLHSLDLRGNQLSSLPVEIGLLVNLQSLDLSNYQLS